MEKTTTKSAKGNLANGSRSKAIVSEETKSALQKFLTDEVMDIYWAEKHLTKALRKMQKAASSDELQQAFQTHAEQTEEHVQRLENVFKLLDHKAQAKKCDAMEGLLKEAESIIDDTEEGTATRDVGLIFAAQKVEHYEIATYGGLTQLATTLGLNEIAGIFRETLTEEKEADELLTEIAESGVNEESATEEETK
jgi:ferritin-like metal-binding protein YciE